MLYGLRYSYSEILTFTNVKELIYVFLCVSNYVYWHTYF